MEREAAGENSLYQSSKCKKTNETKFILSNRDRGERTKTHNVTTRD